ncbi:uncharacterized protein LOC108680506 [Hyalella azteca]|uniref:Uncharacterized protein LOC108680506 n=1 Tax=Hyalella azteca TaxID=294128 RepID=A0A8B7PFA7_HYAAZ|nr:uncharacterized protein LOC108680506 [Hyalella azteca]
MENYETIASLMLDELTLEVQAPASKDFMPGLILSWSKSSARRDEQKSSKMLLSKYSRSALLFESNLTATFCEAILSAGIAKSQSDSQEELPGSHIISSVFILVETGDLLLAIFTGLRCQLLCLGRVPCDIVTIDTMQVCEKILLCVSHSNGALHLLDPTRRISEGADPTSDGTYPWKALSLDTRVLAACTVLDALVTSDGYTISIHHFKLKKVEDTITNKCSCLSCQDIESKCENIDFPGVISLKRNAGNVQMITVDGRRYDISLEKLMKICEARSSEKRDSGCNIPLQNTLIEMQEVSELITKTHKVSEELNAYIQQFNLAQHLLNSSASVTENLFDISYEVCPCFDPDHDYKLEIKLTSTEHVMKGRWWRARLGVPDGDTTRHVTGGLGDSSHTFSIRLSVAEAMRLTLLSCEDESHRLLKVDLIFMDLQCGSPLVCISIKKIMLGVWKFLTEKREVKAATEESSSLFRHLVDMAGVEKPHKLPKAGITHDFSLKLHHSSTLLRKISSLIGCGGNLNESANKSLSKCLYFGCESVVIRLSSAPNLLHVQISSSSAAVAVTLRKDLEQLASLNDPSKDRDEVAITSDLLQDVQFFQCLLDSSVDRSCQAKEVRTFYSRLHEIAATLPT